MILEVAILEVIAGQEENFVAAFQAASVILAAMRGYHTHQLSKCLEQGNRFILLVEWETLEDHTIGFRGSPEYQEWKRLLHHFYSPFPTVEHYQGCL